MMSKEKFYKYMMIGLLCSNLLLLYFYFYKRPRHEVPKRIIAERLHFDAAQIAQYEALILEHRKKVRTIEAGILIQKTVLYQNLVTPNQPNNADSISNEIGVLQKQMELLHFEHFQNLKKICKPAQQPDFYDLVPEFATLFQKKHLKPNK